jgi:adenylate cyclase
MSNSKNYDNNKNNVQSKSNLVKDLNKILSVENASVDRLMSRIAGTPIQEIKIRLKQHLLETRIQKKRLQRIIAELGGKPTEAKADLLKASPPTTITLRKSITKTKELEREDNESNNSILEEKELMKIKQDFTIEADELAIYESLIGAVQASTHTQQQYEIKSSLEKNMREEESMAYWYKIHTPLILDSLWPRMIHTSMRRGQNFLFGYTRYKIPLIIIYADLVSSTSMSMSLPVDMLVTIIRAFTYEVSHVVDSFDGYVLKYVGDAVISFFPSHVLIKNNEDTYPASDKSIECGKSMINIIREVVNPRLNKIYGYPELFTKIGIDAGESAVVQYGYEKNSPIDLLGYSMNIAAKITSLTGANKISIGENVYKSLDHKTQREFHELSMPDNRWKYINYGTDKPYKVYTLNT